MRIVGRKMCPTLGGVWSEDLDRCLPKARIARKFSKSYIITYILAVMLLCIVISRITVELYDPNYHFTDTSEERGEPIVSDYDFEWHHIYYGFILLPIVSVWILLQEKTPDSLLVGATFLGICFSFFADEFLYLIEKSTSGISRYWNFGYLSVSILCFVIFIIIGERAAEKEKPLSIRREFVKKYVGGKK